MSVQKKRGRRGVLLAAALGVVASMSLSMTAAGFFDQAEVEFSPVGGNLDVVFVDDQGGSWDGAPEPFVIKADHLGPIDFEGASDPWTLDVQVRNNGTLPASTVDLRLLTLDDWLTADSDGVVRDVLDVLVATLSDGSSSTGAVPAKDAVLSVKDWPAGETRTVSITLALKRDLPSSHYLSKAFKVALDVKGMS